MEVISTDNMMAKRNYSHGLDLSYLIEGFVDPAPDINVAITGVSFDSRSISPDELFIAIDGNQTSGSKFIDDAIRKGAVAVLVDDKSQARTGSRAVPVIYIPDLRMRVGIIADRFYGEPSQELKVIGVTGTNGKTSVCHFIAQALSNQGERFVGVIGTLGYGGYGKLEAGSNTTPDAVSVHRLLSCFRDQTAEYVVMEVSSHALEQYRVSGVRFDTVVFTNLSHDHLDYHDDMDAYANTKKKLFQMEGLKGAVINIDDQLGKQLVSILKGNVPVISYGVAKDRDDGLSPEVQAVVTKEDTWSMTLGITSPWGAGELSANLTGSFNAYNLLAVLSVICQQNIPFAEALKRLSRVTNIPGRMECFSNANSASIFVDYAHTPDALQQALVSLRKLCSGKLICVFGCGGGRDKGKRPLMGQISESFSDKVILTSDNPRCESPNEIILDILAGFQNKDLAEVEPDRDSAIQTAVNSAHVNDIVLIAGKGHETYQDINGVKIPFSDRQLVRNILELLA